MLLQALLFLVSTIVLGLLYYFYKTSHTFWNEKLQQYMPHATLYESIISLLRGAGKLNGALHTQQLVSKYGPLYSSMLMKQVVVTDANIVKKILLHPSKFPRVTNSPALERKELLNRFLGRNVAFSDGPQWRKHRSMMNPAFVNSSIFLDVFIEKSKHCITKMMAGQANEDGEVGVDIKDMMTKLTLDILGKSIFGMEFGYLDNKESALFEAYHTFFSTLLKNPWLVAIPFISKLPLSIVKKMHECLDILDREIYGIIGEKKKAIQEIIDTMPNEEVSEETVISKMKRKSLLDMMVLSNMIVKPGEQKDGEEVKAMTDKELRDNTVVLFVAGHETTATALSFILHALSTRTEIQEKVREEIVKYLPADSDPSNTDFEQLEYLNCAIKESLRYYPIISLIPDRATEDIQDFNGYTIPKGTSLLCNTYGIHFSDELWSNPKEFKPERFMDDKAIKLGSWMPFGMGGHLCLGKPFSLLEQVVFLGLLLRDYKVSVREELKISTGGIFAPEPYTLYLKKLK